ncbi:hypothetical protein MBLNU230_g7775t1 [Neophaeotheca triangularis]
MAAKRLSTAYLQVSSWFQYQVPLTRLSLEKAAEEFTWDNVTPQSYFVWQPCFEAFKCARLQVPMDWQGTTPEAEKNVEIAVVKLEATVPVTDPTYGGAVVFNPGGPGGSGVGQVLRDGLNFRTVLSAGPNANSETAKGIAKHVSTAAVARDVVEIFERHGQWRQAEAERLMETAADRLLVGRKIADAHTWRLQSGIRERTKYAPGQEMIQYWGFSYGTILGATLAAMYPERISRALLDGVADSHDYMAGGWTTNLVDTDLTFVKLMEYCYEGGKENCAVWHEDGPAFIAAHIQDTISELRSNPIEVPGNATHGPQVATFDDLQSYIGEIVYAPLPNFPKTAQILHELSQGNGTTLAEWKTERLPKGLGKPVSDKCKEDGPFSPSCFDTSSGMMWNANTAIVCTDGQPRTNQTKDEYRRYADKLASQSQLIGHLWAEIQLPCTAWDVRPAWRYDGNFANKTAHPVMFAGNTIDPVTPLQNAFTMAKGFEGAAILHQNSEGHCTLASISMCSGRSIRAYFQNGTLPNESTKHGVPVKLCEPDRLPFDGYTKGSKPAPPEGETDVALWEALVGLNRK